MKTVNNKTKVKEQRVMKFLEDIRTNPNMIKVFTKNAESLISTNRRYETSRHKQEKHPSLINSSVQLSQRLEKRELVSPNKNKSEIYYYKFIHQSNRDQFQRNRASQNSLQYVPFEQLKDLRLKERVNYYMQKLTDEEEGLQNQKKGINKTFDNNDKGIKNTHNSMQDIKIQEQQNIKVEDHSTQRADHLNENLNFKQSKLPHLKLSIMKEHKKSQSLFPNLSKQTSIRSNEYRSQVTLVNEQLHINEIKQGDKEKEREKSRLKNNNLNVPIELLLKSQHTSKGSGNSPFGSELRSATLRDPNMVSHFRRESKKPNKNKNIHKKIHNLSGQGLFTLNDEEREELIMHLIKEIPIFKNDHEKELNPIVEKHFRMMCNDESYNENTNIKVLRLSKKKLRTFLLKYFNQRITEKLIAYFDMLSPLDYHQFYKQVEDNILRINLSKDLRLRYYKQMGFQMYDMNGDNQICEYDLFSIVKHSNDKLFIQALQSDIKDIQFKVHYKSMFQHLDTQQSFGELHQFKNNYKINDLNKFLNERKKINQINDSFLSVFNSPKNQQQQQHQSFADGIDKQQQSINEAEIFKYTQLKTLRLKRQTTRQENDINFQSLIGYQNPPQNNNNALNKSRRQSIGHLLRKVQDLYQKDDVVQISIEEFYRDVTFKYAVPLLVLEFFECITGLNYSNKIKEYFEQRYQTPDINDIYDDEFLNLKHEVSEKFYEKHIVPLFDSLGEIKSIKLINTQQIETKQFITFTSFKQNMTILFGNYHEYFAEIFYKYVAGSSTFQTIKIPSIVKKFSFLWPKRKDEVDENEENNQQQTQTMNYITKLQENIQRKKQLSKIAFDLLDIDGDGQLSILDLIKMQSYFEDNSELAIEIDKLIIIYKDKNVRPKYVRHQFVIDFEKFMKIIPESCLCREMKYIMMDQFIKPFEGYINVFMPNSNLKSNPVDLNEKRKFLNVDGIFDKELLKLQKQ